MFRLRSLAVLVLLVASSLLTLKLMGLSQWIQAILVIAVELSLGVVLHEVMEQSARRERERRQRRSPRQTPSGHHRRRPPGSGGHRHDPSGQTTAISTPEWSATYAPICRLLLPIHNYDQLLINFAVRESRVHRAELDLLFLRKCAVFPMGPLSAPCVDEDEAGREAIDRVRKVAGREGIPFQASYLATADPAASILEYAEERRADFVVMAAPRSGGWISKLLARDELRSVLKALPDRVSLLVHT